MRKVFIAVMMLMSITCASQVIRNGKTFTKVSNVTKSDTLVTDFKWEDTKGNEYPIIINTKSGACWVGKISKKTGKYYRNYLPQEVAVEVSKELNIEYKPKK